MLPQLENPVSEITYNAPSMTMVIASLVKNVENSTSKLFVLFQIVTELANPDNLKSVSLKKSVTLACDDS